MSLVNAATRVFDQLSDLVAHLDPSDFSRPCQTLDGATIGQHVRHTLEFFECLEQGLRNGIVNYDRRRHDKLIEADRELALTCIRKAVVFIQQLDERDLILESNSDDMNGDTFSVRTNAMREMLYNIEHAVHHMAMIKIGVKEVAPYVALPDNFGTAASTIRHRSMAGVPTNLNGSHPA